MNREATFGSIVKERRYLLGLTQAELARRASCAAITIRKIEADAMRPSVQIAEQLAVALNIPEEEIVAFTRLARADPDPSPLPTPEPIPEEIGQPDLSGRAIRGFELGQRLGTGGYGVVYQATQATVSREVAVKIILPKYADRPEFIRRFETEAQLVARLEHPHIVPLYDYWREPGKAFLIMRLLLGGSLEARLDSGPLPAEIILNLMEQICAGLYAAHRAGIVHRDIKPANILLDGDGNAYLADFGIAKLVGNENPANLTMEGTVIGSPAYISPEQILAEPVKPQSDIYSMGVMLYELLTGRKPFKGPTPFAFIQQHLNQSLPLLSATPNGDDTSSSTGQPIPTALDIVIGRATAKDQHERYPDIIAMLADLRQAMRPGSTVATLAASQSLEIEPSHVSEMLKLPDLANPYKGLRPFSEADAADFFGRETLIQDLLARLSELNDPAVPAAGRDLARFLAVVGPSGSGKSSVVRAGLIPVLRNGGLPGSEKWFVVEMLPGPHPLEELEAALLRVAVNPPKNLLQILNENERGLLRAARQILPADEAVELVLVIDQFEEIFTLVEDETSRAHLLNCIVTAVLDPRSRLRTIITLRADFTDQPLRYVDFGDLVRQRSEFVLPLTADELQQAIVGPTERAGLTLEPDLAPTIIREIGDQPSMLPLLQYALTELFERREGRLLTLAAYQASGGVLGALARRADELYTGLNDAEQEAARQLFLRLVTLGEGVEDTRRRVLRAEVEALSDAKEQRSKGAGEQESRDKEEIQNPMRSLSKGKSKIQNVIDLFGRYRLLTFDRDPITRGPTIEVAHEALLREWDRLREWLDASRNDIRLQRLLATAAAEWREANQDASFLLRGIRLDQFADWTATTTLALTLEERAFLEASLADRAIRRAEEAARQQRELEAAQKLAKTEKHRAEEQTRAAAAEKRRAEAQTQAAQRLRWLVVGLVIFLGVAMGAAWFAFNQRNIAHNNLVTAERIRLAAQAQIALDQGEDAVVPALLALQSLQYGYSPEADAALLSALGRGFARQRFVGHVDALISAVLSPDGQYVLTAANDTTARLWDAQTGQEIRQFNGHADLVSAAIFSPDGRFVLTGSADRTVRLWDVDTGQELRRFPQHSSPVWALAFSPDGRSVLTSDESGSAWLWDFQTAQVAHELTGHSDPILWGSFSPDGHYVFTGSIDKTARLWDVSTGQELRRFEGHAGAVSGGQFSPDGRLLVTSSYDNTARLWDIASGQELLKFLGHTSPLRTAVFSPDGRYVLTSSHDKTARLWDTETGQELRQFTGHTAEVSSAAFSPDGQYVLASSVDRTALLWHIQFESEPRLFATSLRTLHTADVVSVRFSPEGQQVITGLGNGVVTLWNIQTGQATQWSKFDTGGPITTLTFSPDGNFALTASGDGIVRLWDLRQTGQEVQQFMGHTGPVWDVAFSPDGGAIVTGSDDGTARLWDLRQTGAKLHQLAGHTGPVRGVAFSPDGRTVLTGSDDGTARLWDTQTGAELLQFAGHAGRVRGVAFSPDNRMVLTGSDDHTARLWDVQTGQEVRQFVGHTDQVWSVTFSPDGRYVLTGSYDLTARLWDISTGQVVRQFVGHMSALRSLAFSADGRRVLIGDFTAAYLWRTELAETVAFACAQLPRDFTTDERIFYSITTDESICAEHGAEVRPITPAGTPLSTAAGSG